MSIYDEFRELAEELLVGEFGRKATLSRNSSTYNKLTDTVNVSGTSQAVYATLAPLKVTSNSGKLLVKSAVRLLVKPEIGDTITFGSESYKIETVEVVQGDTQDIIYYAEVSR